MFAVAIISVFMAVIMAMTVHSQTLMNAIDEHRAVLDNKYIALANEAFQSRLARTGSLGTMTLASIQTVGATNGDGEGFATKSIDPIRMSLSSATGLNDGTWIFDRLAVYVTDKENLYFDILAASSNRCDSSAGFATASVWCGPETGVAYHLIETRQSHMLKRVEESVRSHQTLSKLARSYSDLKRFPNGGLVSGTANRLCVLGSVYDGQANCLPAQCFTVRTLDEAPLDCSDLISAWGESVILNNLNQKHIALTAKSLNVRVSASGDFQKTARELRVP